MVVTAADLAHHIETLRRLYARVLEANIELLRRAHGESVVDEALRLANEATQPKQTPQPPSAERASEAADALDRVMGASALVSRRAVL